MEFHEFLHLLSPIVVENHADFVKSFFAATVNESTKDFDSDPDHPLRMTKDGYRKIFNGDIGISRKVSYLLQNFNEDSIKEFIDSRTPDNNRYFQLASMFDCEEYGVLQSAIVYKYWNILHDIAMNPRKKKKTIGDRIDAGEKVTIDMKKISYDPQTKKVEQCPKCGCTGFDIEKNFCPDCGTSLINYCLGKPSRDYEDTIHHACLPYERNCPECGAPTMYLKEYHLMKPIEEERGYTVRDGKYQKVYTDDDLPF